MHLKTAKLCAVTCSNFYTDDNFIYDIYSSKLTRYKKSEVTAFTYIVDLFIGTRDFEEGDTVISLQSGARYVVSKVISPHIFSAYAEGRVMFKDEIQIVENINYVKILGAPSRVFIRDNVLGGTILPEDEVLVDLDNLLDRDNRIKCRPKTTKKYGIGSLKTRFKLFAQQIYGDAWTDTHEVWFAENFK